MFKTDRSVIHQFLFCDRIWRGLMTHLKSEQRGINQVQKRGWLPNFVCIAQIANEFISILCAHKRRLSAC